MQQGSGLGRNKSPTTILSTLVLARLGGPVRPVWSRQRATSNLSSMTNLCSDQGKAVPATCGPEKRSRRGSAVASSTTSFSTKVPCPGAYVT